jgi:hypothetical protein
MKLDEFSQEYGIKIGDVDKTKIIDIDFYNGFFMNIYSYEICNKLLNIVDDNQNIIDNLPIYHLTIFLDKLYGILTKVMVNVECFEFNKDILYTIFNRKMKNEESFNYFSTFLFNIANKIIFLKFKTGIIMLLLECFIKNREYWVNNGKIHILLNNKISEFRKCEFFEGHYEYFLKNLFPDGKCCYSNCLCYKMDDKYCMFHSYYTGVLVDYMNNYLLNDISNIIINYL